MNNQIIQLPNFVWGKFVEFNKLNHTYRIMENGYQVIAGSKEFDVEQYNDFYKKIPPSVIGKPTGENKGETDVYSLSILEKHCVWSHYYYPIPEGENHRSFIAQHHFLIPKNLFLQDTRKILLALLLGLTDESGNYTRNSYFLGTVDLYKNLEPFELYLPDEEDIEIYARKVLDKYVLQNQKDYCLLRSILNSLNGKRVIGITGINQDMRWRLNVLSGIVAISSAKGLQEFSFCTHSYLTANQTDYRLRFWESGYLPDDMSVQKINYEFVNCDSAFSPQQNNQGWGDMIIAAYQSHTNELGVLTKEILNNHTKTEKSLQQDVKEKILYRTAHLDDSDIETKIEYLLLYSDSTQEFELYTQVFRRLQKLDLSQTVSILKSSNFLKISHNFIRLGGTLRELFATLRKVDVGSSYKFLVTILEQGKSEKFSSEFLTETEIFINNLAIDALQTEQAEENSVVLIVNLLDLLFENSLEKKLIILSKAYYEKQKDIVLREILRNTLRANSLTLIKVAGLTSESDLLSAYNSIIDNKALNPSGLRLDKDDILILFKLGLKFDKYIFLTPELLAKIYTYYGSSILPELSTLKWKSNNVSTNLFFGAFVLLSQMLESNAQIEDVSTIIKHIEEQDLFVVGSIRFFKSLLDNHENSSRAEQALGKIIQYTISEGWVLDIWEKALIENNVNLASLVLVIKKSRLIYNEKERVTRWVQDNQQILLSTTSQSIVNYVLKLVISTTRLAVDLGDRDFSSHANWIKSILKTITLTEENIEMLKMDIRNSFSDDGENLWQNISSVLPTSLSQTKNYDTKKNQQVAPVGLNEPIYYIHIAQALSLQEQPINAIRGGHILNKSEYMLKLWHALLLVGNQRTAILIYRKIFDMLGGRGFDNGKELRNELVGKLSEENLNILDWLRDVVEGESDDLKKQQSKPQKKRPPFEIWNPFKKTGNKNKIDEDW